MGRSIYLLTGATGNLGGNILYALLEKGERIRVLVRNPSKLFIHDGIEVIKGHLLDVRSLGKFFSVGDDLDIYVIHSAGRVTVNPDYDKEVFDTNVIGTKNIIEQCVKHNVRKLVYVSSTGAIPEIKGDKPIVETDRFDPDEVTGYYSKSKAMASQLVLDAVESHDLDASIVFPSGIMGPYDYGFGFITKAVTDFAMGRIPFAIKGTFNCTDGRDLARGIISCCRKGRKGEGYIMANGTVTMHELFDIIAETTGRRWTGITFPAWVAGAFAYLSELYGKIMKKPILFTRFTIYNISRNNNFSSEKAKRELGYSTRPFTETIRDEILWLREQGKIS